MKFLAILFILSFFILECHQKALTDGGDLEERNCFGGRTANPFANLLKKKVVYVSTEPDCSTLMTAQETLNGQLKRFTPTGVCNTGYRSNDLVRIYNYVTDDSGRNYQSCGTGPSANAYWLDQEPNMSTYMILNNANAHWFFTVTLSGCDIFIAVDTSKRGEPLVIHANQDRFKTQPQQNFEAKQMNTDNILRQHAGYALKARLHMERSGLTTFWGNYANGANRGVERKEYKESATYTFFGSYNSRTRSWVFYYKSNTDGAVQTLYDTKN